ncbi:MAG TPA: cupin domain-containing protein [Burkholderiales bacterium]|nr:cupin domain-containing protein [Burkholderiales bacterium]
MMDPESNENAPESLKGTTLKAADLVTYQDGAVVSREIVRGKGGTVTVFAFDKGQQLSEHTAPFDALVVGLDGTADISIAGRGHRLGAGEAIIMPARILHGLKAVSRFKMLLVMVKK